MTNQTSQAIDTAPETPSTFIDWESERFEAAVSELGLDEAVGCILRCADRRLTIEMPIHMDDDPHKLCAHTGCSTLMPWVLQKGASGSIRE